MGRVTALLLLLLCLSAAAERKAHRAPPCREEEGGDAQALCQSRGLRDSPICALSDGRFVLAMRSEFGFEFTHALPGAYALARQGCVLHALTVLLSLYPGCWELRAGAATGPRSSTPSRQRIGTRPTASGVGRSRRPRRWAGLLRPEQGAFSA
jgi:hypothetical protein